MGVGTSATQVNRSRSLLTSTISIPLNVRPYTVGQKESFSKVPFELAGSNSPEAGVMVNDGSLFEVRYALNGVGELVWRRERQHVGDKRDRVAYSVGLYRRKPMVDVLFKATASMVISSSGGASSVEKRSGYLS